MTDQQNLLVSGLGGGLDILNASLLYFSAKSEGTIVHLGSAKPVSLHHITDHQPFADSGTLITSTSVIHKTSRNRKGGYISPQLVSLLKENIFYFSRKYKDKTDVPRLRQAVQTAQQQYGFTTSLFVDGGGDSLVLTKKDACDTSEHINPFEGGDAQMLEALADLPNTYLGVICVGLDIKEEAFHRNIALLKEKNAYHGRVNLKTGQKDGYTLDHIISFEKPFLHNYFNLAEHILTLKEEDFSIDHKSQSHTAVLTYHALKGNIGLQRTWVNWEPTQPDGTKGTIVTPEHAWMHFFDASKIHAIKKELNL